jgi:hypothetical protein
LAGDLWRHLYETCFKAGETDPAWEAPVRCILDHGSLARRILKALGGDRSREHLQEVYSELCDGLERGAVFLD